MQLHQVTRKIKGKISVRRHTFSFKLEEQCIVHLKRDKQISDISNRTRRKHALTHVKIFLLMILFISLLQICFTFNSQVHESSCKLVKYFLESYSPHKGCQREICISFLRYTTSYLQVSSSSSNLKKRENYISANTHARLILFSSKQIKSIQSTH